MGSGHLRPHPAVEAHENKLHVITQEHVAISNRSEARKRTRQSQAGSCLASCSHFHGLFAQNTIWNLVKLQRRNWSSFRWREQARRLGWLPCIYPIHSASTQKVPSRTTAKPPRPKQGRKQIAALAARLPACTLTGGTIRKTPTFLG